MANNAYAPKILPSKNKKHLGYKFVLHFGHNPRQHKHFKTREEAEAYMRSVLEKGAHEFSTGERPLSPGEFYEYSKFSEILSPYGTLKEIVKTVCEWITVLQDTYKETLEQAVDNYVECDIAKFVPKSLPDVIDEYMNLLSQSRSEAYMAQIRYSLGRFQNFFPEETRLTDISKDRIVRWFHIMTEKPGPQGRPLGEYAKYNLLRAVQIFFNYCKRRGYVPINPAIDIERPTLPQDDPPFYSVSDARKLLYAARNQSIRLFLVLALFGGFRTTEMLRMRWRHIDFDHYDVIIDASMTKTRTRRRIHLPYNAQAWLEPFKNKTRNPEDKVFPWDDMQVFYNALNSLHNAAGVKRIKNGLRHTCATYTLAHIGDPVVVSDRLGNSPEVLKRHYASLTTPSEAKEFFEIYPKAK